jgi:cation transport ATPase
MAQTLRDTRTGKLYQVDDTNIDTSDNSTAAKAEYGTSVAARVVSFIGGVIMALLGLRFLLMLLGANRGNGLVDFIYTASYPFAAPFFGIFNYQEQIGRSRFEFETLIAIAVYGLIAWAIIRLLTIANRRDI